MTLSPPSQLMTSNIISLRKRKPTEEDITPSLTKPNNLTASPLARVLRLPSLNNDMFLLLRKFDFSTIVLDPFPSPSVKDFSPEVPSSPSTSSVFPSLSTFISTQSCCNTFHTKDRPWPLYLSSSYSIVLGFAAEAVRSFYSRYPLPFLPPNLIMLSPPPLHWNHSSGSPTSSFHLAKSDGQLVNLSEVCDTANHPFPETFCIWSLGKHTLLIFLPPHHRLFSAAFVGCSPSSPPLYVEVSWGSVFGPLTLHLHCTL